MPLSRRATICTLFGFTVVVGAIAVIVDRFRRPNQLFLYSYRSFPDDPPGTSSAAVATIGPDFFQIENTFEFGDWTTVANATNGKNKWLFLHNKYNGSAETGLIDGSHRYQSKKRYPPGTFSDWPFEYTVVNGLGQLLLIDYKSEDGVAVGLAEVLEDGTFVEWWRTRVDIPPPDWNVSSVVGLAKAHAWFSSSPAVNQRPTGGSTIIFDVKHARVVSTRRSEVEWHGIAVDGDLLYLFNKAERKSEICRLNDNLQLVTVKASGVDPDLVNNPDQYVVSTTGAHLSYNYPGRDAHVRVLRPSGFPATYKVDDMGKVWVDIVPC